MLSNPFVVCRSLARPSIAFQTSASLSQAKSTHSLPRSTSYKSKEAASRPSLVSVSRLVVSPLRLPKPGLKLTMLCFQKQDIPAPMGPSTSSRRCFLVRTCDSDNFPYSLDHRRLIPPQMVRDTLYAWYIMCSMLMPFLVTSRYTVYDLEKNAVGFAKST